MKPERVRELLEEYGAMRTGHFLLSSGKHSDGFVQSAAVLRWPKIAEELGAALGKRFASSGATVVLGPAMGGVIIGHEIARELDLPLIYSERVDGAMALRRG